MSNADICRLLSPLYDDPAQFHELSPLLPGMSRSEVREVGEYLNGTGLAEVKAIEGSVVARIGVSGRLFVERERRSQ